MAILRESRHIARKAHYDDSSEWLTCFDYRTELEMTFSEWGSVAELKANEWKIQPGQEYIQQVGIWEGDFYCMKTLPVICEICCKYDLYGDD